MNFANILKNTIDGYIRNINSNSLGYIVNANKECGTNLMFNIYLSRNIYHKSHNINYKNWLDKLYHRAKQIIR